MVVLIGEPSKSTPLFRLSELSKDSVRSAQSGIARQHQRRLTAEVVELVQVYRAGSSMHELAVQFGVHRTTVAACLRRLAIPLRRQGLYGDDLAEAIKLYQDGWSLARLGDKFGCDAETVRQALKRRGVDRHGPHER